MRDKQGIDNKALQDLTAALLLIGEEWPKRMKELDERDESYAAGIKAFMDRQRQQDDRLAQCIEAINVIRKSVEILVDKYENLIN